MLQPGVSADSCESIRPRRKTLDRMVHALRRTDVATHALIYYNARINRVAPRAPAHHSVLDPGRMRRVGGFAPAPLRVRDDSSTHGEIVHAIHSSILIVRGGHLRDDG